MVQNRCIGGTKARNSLLVWGWCWGKEKIYEADTNQIKLERWAGFQQALNKCQLYARLRTRTWHKGEREGWGSGKERGVEFQAEGPTWA